MIALFAILAVTLVGCVTEFLSNNVDKWRETVTNSLQYHDHAHLPVTVLEDGVEYVSFESFPEMLDAIAGGGVDRCVVGYGEDFPLGEHVQNFVSFVFESRESFGEAISRLGDLTPYRIEGGTLYRSRGGGEVVATTDEALFDLPAFVSVFAYEGVFEYVLADESSLTAYYVYLRSVSAQDVAFDDRFVPAGYENGREAEFSFALDIYKDILPSPGR